MNQYQSPRAFVRQSFTYCLVAIGAEMETLAARENKVRISFSFEPSSSGARENV
jgi:hypothetical protein